MLPGSEKRKKRNSAKVNLFLSLTFHSLLVAGIFYFAAREGILGSRLKTISVFIEPEKKPEVKPPLKKEPELPKEPDPIKPVEAKIVAVPKITETAPPPVVESSGPVDLAPPPAEPPPFEFSGGVTVITNEVQ